MWKWCWRWAKIPNPFRNFLKVDEVTDPVVARRLVVVFGVGVMMMKMMCLMWLSTVAVVSVWNAWFVQNHRFGSTEKDAVKARAEGVIVQSAGTTVYLMMVPRFAVAENPRW